MAWLRVWPAVQFLSVFLAGLNANQPAAIVALVAKRLPRPLHDQALGVQGEASRGRGAAEGFDDPPTLAIMRAHFDEEDSVPRKSAMLALLALPLAATFTATLGAQELSDEQRAEIAARIAPVGDVCLQGENCGGKPATSNTPTRTPMRAGGTVAAAPAKPAASSKDSMAGGSAGDGSANDDSAGDGDAQQGQAAEASVAAAGDKADDAGEAGGSAAADPEMASIDGEAIYNQACVACHASGVGGAPVVGDIDSWSPRIAKGIEALHNSGVNGVAGSAMMAKGGRADLSDQQVMAAVDYMVDASQ